MLIPDEKNADEWLREYNEAGSDAERKVIRVQLRGARQRAHREYLKAKEVDEMLSGCIQKIEELRGPADIES